ncbi:DEAD/DEAH box helicase [Silvimonas sp.]|uniref:DEAD/DEAH box helicase n=1 Tax=Silvimonas sp. TaxID=2650811 RepID=UPI00283AF90F|nr:DEAD/DEAH box helicase [Silvimonas sp.]MDR3427793.1 DEAD/DEAH box helicase [Silvimonas sp.]
MIQIDERTKSVVLQAVDPLGLRELLPKSKMLAHPDFNFAAKHDLQTTLLLRNMGYQVPSPIRYQYGWPGKFIPFDHQIAMAEFWSMHRRAFNLSEAGTGKTNGVLWAADYLMGQGQVDSALVVAPLSTIRTIWMQDIFDTLMHRRAVVVHGTRDQRREALRSPADFYLLNHDGVKILEIMRMIRDNPTINLVVIDEGDEFRNHDTAKYKALVAMLRPDMRIWWQTGTPIPNNPTDAWAQARIINPEGTPKWFGAFKRETMMQLTPFKWAPKKGSNERAFQLLQPAIRFKKRDCLDLPDVVTTSRQAQLTDAQRAAFATMKNDMIMENAEVQARGGHIAAVHAADQIGKLRQILCGCVKEPKTENYVEIPHQPRIYTLMECIRSASAKVIVIVPFKGITESLAAELRKHYSVGLLNGDVSANKRHETVQAFKHTPDPHILLCHPKVMSHGLNLTEADTTIFYAPIYSNSQYQQVIERFNRAGQVNKMTVYKIAAHPMEWEIYRQTELAIANQESILSLYSSLLQ